LAASRSIPEGAVRVAELEAVAEPEVVVRAEVLVAELGAAAAAELVEPEEPVVALGEPEARVEQAEPAEPVEPEALEVKAREEMLEAQAEEPAGRAAQTTTTTLMRIL